MFRLKIFYCKILNEYSYTLILLLYIIKAILKVFNFSANVITALSVQQPVQKRSTNIPSISMSIQNQRPINISSTSRQNQQSINAPSALKHNQPVNIPSTSQQNQRSAIQGAQNKYLIQLFCCCEISIRKDYMSFCSWLVQWNFDKMLVFMFTGQKVILILGIKWHIFTINEIPKQKKLNQYLFLNAPYFQYFPTKSTTSFGHSTFYGLSTKAQHSFSIKTIVCAVVWRLCRKSVGRNGQ